MVHFNFNLTTVAVILWSGMLIISGSIWVLASQVRKLADLYEGRADTGATAVRPPAPRRDSMGAGRSRVTRRSTSAISHRNARPAPESPYS
jgi:hypothetical protein